MAKQLSLLECLSTVPDDDPAWDERGDLLDQVADDQVEATIREMTPEEQDRLVDAWLRLLAREDRYYAGGL